MPTMDNRVCYCVRSAQHAKEEISKRSFFKPSKQFIKTYLKSFPNDPILQPDGLSNGVELTNGDTNESHELDLLSKAKRAFEHEDYLTAIRHCTEEIESTSSNHTKALARLLRATVYIFTSQSTKAIEDLTQLVEDTSVDPKIKVNAHIKRAVVHLHAASDFTKAFADLDEAEKVDPNVADSYYQRGQIYCLFGQYEEALRNLDKTIALNPNFHVARAQRHFVVHKMIVPGDRERVEQSLKEFRNFVDTHSNVVEACTLFAQVLVDQEDFDGAEEYFNRSIKACCESILKVMTLGNVIVISNGLQTLHALFSSHPCPLNTCTPQLNAQLINALYDYQPPSSDSQPTLAWLTTLQAAFGNLARVELGLCMSNLHRFMSLCTQLWLSDKIEVVNGATHTVQVLIQDCVEKAASPDVVSHHKTSLHKIFQLLEQCMSYQYNKAWKQILHILALMFKAAGATCHEFMVKCLQSLAELRDSYNFPYVNELDYAVGAAVRTMGVDVVLRHVPYQISFNEKGNEIKRSWMLPVLKANIQNASIGFFIEHFLPLASQCRKKSEEFRQSDSTAAAVSYDLLQTQIWSLLPSFCNKPKDIESFPKLAKVLGNVLINFKDLRLTVMLALRKLMEDNPECPVMRKYAKNYLPILLNIYTTQPKGTDDDNIRTSTFQTIAMYASRAEQSLLHELLESAVIKIKKATENTDDVKSKEEMKFLKSSILDVIRVLLPYQHVRDVEEVFKFLQNTLKESKDSTETKKVYRILQELCESEQKGSQEFISNHLDDVIQVLLEPMESKTLMPSQAARVKCITALLLRMSEDQIVNVIPPAVAGIKSINSSCRDYSFELITKIADRIFELKQEAGLCMFIDNLSVGLQGNPKIASASILALASVTHHCRNFLVGTESLSTLLSNILILLTSNTREIVGSCLSFIKLLLTSFHKDDNAPHVPAIVREISSMVQDCKRHFRIKIKDIFVRLLRKYGDDVIFHMIPTHDAALVKQVKNMIKIRRRKSKDKQKNEAEENDEEEEFSVKSKPKTITEILDEIEKDDDEDLLDMDEKPKQNGKKKKKKQTFIQENEDEILDFTDMTNMNKISTTKPTSALGNNNMTNQKTKKKEEFKMSEDGRLIITESDSDGEVGTDKLGKMKIKDDDEEDEEDQENAKTILTESRKRKRGTSDKGSVRSEPANKYQAGGSGIHRPIKTTSSKPSKSQDPGCVYKSKKSQGDMKRKGMPDPYAYVPLTRKLLNKRKRNKSTGQFKNIIKGAKKGAKIGNSMKSKNAKKNKK
ncbi:hypothetical protein M8J76_011259 [Diaphorina citri]|nr:hypothetical protein M8J76_011259 [Diaphorina citri]